MRKLISSTCLAGMLTLLSLSVAAAGTYTAEGTVVNLSGQPRANWTVAVSFKYDPLFWWTVHTTTDSNGHFSVSRDFASVTYLMVSPAQGNSATQATPTPGTYNFGSMIGGNCKNCPLPEDGSGQP